MLVNNLCALCEIHDIDKKIFLALFCPFWKYVILSIRTLVEGDRRDKHCIFTKAVSVAPKAPTQFVHLAFVQHASCIHPSTTPHSHKHSDNHTETQNELTERQLVWALALQTRSVQFKKICFIFLVAQPVERMWTDLNNLNVIPLLIIAALQVYGNSFRFEHISQLCFFFFLKPFYVVFVEMCVDVQ